jgi:hypothetical protein
MSGFPTNHGVYQITPDSDPGRVPAQPNPASIVQPVEVPQKGIIVQGEAMEERFAFWKGVTAGILGGIAIGALTRFAVAEEAVLEGSLPHRADSPREMGAPAYAAGHRRLDRVKIDLRREGAESAGDPRITSPGAMPGTAQGRAFERPPGAPGGRTPAERLDHPGRPGKTVPVS